LEGMVIRMYDFEQQIRVWLQFNAMEAPVEISVPWNVLRYLDTHGERCIAPDGSVIYFHPEMPARTPVQKRLELCAAAA
jgi:hypothetical protein